MSEYGAYKRETKKLLRSYPKMKIAVTNLMDEIEMQKMSQSIAEQVQEVRRRRDEIIMTIRTIDEALESLGEIERALVRRHYIGGEPWKQVSKDVPYKEKWTRARGANALKYIACRLFGVRPLPRLQPTR